MRGGNSVFSPGGDISFFPDPVYRLWDEGPLYICPVSTIELHFIAYSERHNYWVSGLFPSSGILGNRGHDVSETGSVSVFR
jgi:hypothetical protein